MLFCLSAITCVWFSVSPRSLRCSWLSIGGYDNIFTMKMHHGGILSPFPERMYINDEVDYFHVIIHRGFIMLDLHIMMRELKDDEALHICHHFLMP